ncbi:ComEC/Rec2 family competence protein [Sphingobacterium faecium]|nr:ComEC/Rec2 family competence protein [Sphingobacterium faecium]MDH5827814.1 ComEC/Rec2 family competence protein [Sphingobacterium faecium]
MKTNFHEQVKKVPFLKIVIFYGMGIGLAHFIPAGNATFSILNAILITVLLSQVVWFIMQPRFRSLYIINSYVILFVFGLWNISRTHFKNDANHFHLGASDQFIAIVDDEPIVKNNTVRFSALLRAKETKSTFRKATGNLMMTVELDRTAPIQYGDEIIFINKIKAIPNHYNPLEFDYKNY